MNDHCKAAERRLNSDEIAGAKRAVAAAKPGLYSVRELFKESWAGKRRPRAYGKWFKASALAGDLPGLQWVRRRSNRSQEYQVMSAPDLPQQVTQTERQEPSLFDKELLSASFGH